MLKDLQITFLKPQLAYYKPLNRPFAFKSLKNILLINHV